MLRTLYENNLLPHLFDGAGAVLDRIDQQTLKDEKDAKTDIYNYAARFNCVPEITTSVVKKIVRRRMKLVTEITVALSEQGILVTAVSDNFMTAETIAAVKFKEAAEKYQSGLGTSSIIIKDANSLNTSNVRSFVEFYKSIKPGITFSITSERPSVDPKLGVGLLRTQATIDGEPIGRPVEMLSAGKAGIKLAENLAYLTAAVAILKEDPEIGPQYFKALKDSNGEILPILGPIDMPIDADCVEYMRGTLLSAREAGFYENEEQTTISNNDGTVTNQRTRSRRQLSPDEINLRNDLLHTRYSKYLRDPKLVELRQKKDDLPMNQYKGKVLDIVDHNPYSIIVGATGSGKTTQVPQILLDRAISIGEGANCNVICTQPRRIAATSVAQRVAVERAENIQETVGYQVRFDARVAPPGGSINYCTTGILLQQLQHSPDETLDTISHLIIDEVHERDTQIDFLLIILKEVLKDRAKAGKINPKIILMSATLNTELFASYFASKAADGSHVSCPSLSVPGRTFPVKETHLNKLLQDLRQAHPASDLYLLQRDQPSREYLDVEKQFILANPIARDESVTTENAREEESIIDWKRAHVRSESGELSVSTEREDALVPCGLAAATIAHIIKTTEAGAILVFLPGLQEISQVNKHLEENPMGINFQDQRQNKIYMLHSSLSDSQNEIFETPPPGCRKIILATNIGETSITIPDVQYVVDAGKLRQRQYDQMKRITSLQCTWISKSNSKQRAGRAGRVQNGNYYALFSRERYDSMRAVGLPEILRVDLQDICLDVKAQAFESPIRDFLAAAIEPPSPSAVDSSVRNLEALGALTEEEEITPLGRLLASLPVHPSLGKMIVLGIIFRCLDPMLVLGAAAEERSLFANPLGARAAALEARTSFVQGSGSDHIATLNAVRELRKLQATLGRYAMQDFAVQNFLYHRAFQTVENTAKQIEEILVNAKIIPYTAPHERYNFQYGSPALNENSHRVPLIKALATAGLHPNLATAMGGRLLRTPNEKAAMIHPSSVNAPKDRQEKIFNTTPRGTLMTYSVMSRSNDGKSVYLRDTSETTPLISTLFGGKLSRNGNILEMDNWLPFYIKSTHRDAIRTILKFREALERLLLNAFRDLAPKSGNGGMRYLADDQVREMFASGVVGVLDRDVRSKEEVLSKGWGQRETNFPVRTVRAREKPRFEGKQDSSFYDALLGRLEKKAKGF